ncbi:MAG: alginate lyase family protein [Rhizomicrobium sp.]
MNVSWYARRLGAMGPHEVAQRLVDRLHETKWRRRYFATGAHPQMVATDRDFTGGLSRARAASAPAEARDNLLRCAEKLLAGEWSTFAITRNDVTPDVDWHLDPKSGSSVPAKVYAFDIPFVGGASAVDTKYVWELSRHHHTTILAMAYWLTGDERYARAAAGQIESWIGANPFLAGIHWSSSIEIGMRLIAFTWTRRLLVDWPRVREHFEDNENFARCVFLHQWLLAHRRSYGSSANNHLIYEMAGLYISTCCMPWHVQAAEWRVSAATILEREFPRQIFADGYSRELACDYNGFVLEALLLCLIECEMNRHPLGAGAWDCVRRMFRWLGDNSDCRGRPPRQGDSDDASGLLLDTPGYDRWRDLAYFSDAWFGQAAQTPQSLRAWLLAPLVQPPADTISREADVSHPRESGLVVLRARRHAPNEIWCAFDAGPLGYLAIAAHGHTDALAIELRYGGRPVLVDPGTYAYSGPWRDWFRSTAAHNTIELEGRNQSNSGGPFLWTRHARARLLEVGGLADDATCARAAGEHDGYARPPLRGQHRRSVTLDRQNATLTICDELSVARRAPVRMFYHLHPEIGCALSGRSAELDCNGSRIRLKLPVQLTWHAVRGSENPMLGWYSPSFDVKLPATTLVGETRLARALALTTVVQFPAA